MLTSCFSFHPPSAPHCDPMSPHMCSQFHSHSNKDCCICTCEILAYSRLFSLSILYCINIATRARHFIRPPPETSNGDRRGLMSASPTLPSSRARTPSKWKVALLVLATSTTFAFVLRVRPLLYRASIRSRRALPLHPFYNAYGTLLQGLCRSPLSPTVSYPRCR